MITLESNSNLIYQGILILSRDEWTQMAGPEGQMSSCTASPATETETPSHRSRRDRFRGGLPAVWRPQTEIVPHAHEAVSVRAASFARPEPPLVDGFL